MKKINIKRLNVALINNSKKISKIKDLHNATRNWDMDKETRKNKEKTFKHFLKFAEHGNENGQYWTGVNYISGRGVQEDLNKAEKYLTLAVEQGHLNALKYLEIVQEYFTLIKNLEEMESDILDMKKQFKIHE